MVAAPQGLLAAEASTQRLGDMHAPCARITRTQVFSMGDIRPSKVSDPEARTALVWILGQFGKHIESECAAVLRALGWCMCAAPAPGASNP
jgi:hypothetical protein